MSDHADVSNQADVQTPIRLIQITHQNIVAIVSSSSEESDNDSDHWTDIEDVIPDFNFDTTLTGQKYLFRQLHWAFSNCFGTKILWIV